MKFTVIIEKGNESKAEAKKNIKEAMEVYLEVLNEEQRQDVIDIELIQRRKNEPGRPFREYLADRSRNY
jgi:hypothetical protein